MPRRAYDLHGVVIAVVAVNDELAGFLEPFLGPLATAETMPPDWTIAIETVGAVGGAPAGAPQVWDGPLPEGWPATLYDEGDRRVFVAPDRFTMTHRRGVHATEIAVAPSGWKAIAATPAFWLLDHILVAFDHHLLHGACLIRRDPPGAIAMFAPSGTGKTTTALALARAGLALAGDDALVLKNADDDAYLWGIPRRLRVHRKTAGFMPWVQPYLAEWTTDEQPLAREALAGVIEIAGPVRLPAIGAIMLRQPNAAGHRVEAIARTDAVSHIVADNVRRAPTGVEAGHQAAFAAIARFVARTPVVALSVGPDPGSLDLAAILAALR